jgi:gliding motility-associated-like protein
VSTTGGPTANAGNSVVITSGSTTILNGSGSAGATFSWSPSATLSCNTCPNPTAAPTQTTTYTLTVTLNGCSTSDTVTVFIDILCGELFVPTAFSPNGDNQNDILYVFGNCITNLQFAIFDRWGEKVFETTNQLEGWDGTFNGKKMDPAAFAYYLSATVKGEEVKKHGNITLVK